jgi:hypothetical protein
VQNPGSQNRGGSNGYSRGQGGASRPASAPSRGGGSRGGGSRGGGRGGH